MGNRGVLLLYEKRFAQLVAADEGFHCPVTAEEILNFPVLINALRGTNDWARNHLQRTRIGEAITLEAFGLLAVEHGEDDATGPQQFCQAGDNLLHHSLLEIVQKIPKKNGVERAARVLQILFHKARGPGAGSHFDRFAGREVLSQTRFFFIQKTLPRTENVFGSDAKTALNKETQSSLRGRAHIEKRAALQAVQVPEELLQTVRKPVGFLFDWSASCAGLRGWRTGSARAGSQVNRAGNFVTHLRATTANTNPKFV